MGNRFHKHPGPVPQDISEGGLIYSLAGKIALTSFKRGISPSILEILSLLLYISATVIVANSGNRLILAVIIFILAGILIRSSQFLANEYVTGGSLHRMFALATRNMASGIFYGACAVSVYRQSNDTTYLFAAIFSFFMWAYLTTFISRYSSVRPELSYDLLGRKNAGLIKDVSPHLLERRFFKFLGFLREDYWALLLFVFGGLEMAGILFWSSFVLLVVSFIAVIRLLKITEPDDSGGITRSEIFFLFLRTVSTRNRHGVAANNNQ